MLTMLEEFFIALSSSLLCPGIGPASVSWEVPSLGVAVCGSRVLLSCPSSALATGCVTLGKSRLLSVDGTLTRPKCASTTC